jgi:hypothetical protein
VNAEMDALDGKINTMVEMVSVLATHQMAHQMAVNPIAVGTAQQRLSSSSSSSTATGLMVRPAASIDEKIEIPLRSAQALSECMSRAHFCIEIPRHKVKLFAAQFTSHAEINFRANEALRHMIVHCGEAALPLPTGS